MRKRGKRGKRTAVKKVAKKREREREKGGSERELRGQRNRAAKKREREKEEKVGGQKRKEEV